MPAWRWRESVSDGKLGQERLGGGEGKEGRKGEHRCDGEGGQVIVCEVEA